MGVMFMTAVEGTIVATAMPTIAANLGGYELFGWTFAAYLLAQATTIPIYGRLADLYGRKPVFFTGVGIFILGSALCGAAPTMVLLVLARAVQGLGAGGIVPVAQTIIGDVFSPAERARIQGYLSSMWAISAIIGPLLGAFIVDRLSWPLIFWFNIPLALLVITLIAALFRETPKRADHTIDILGAVLLVISVGGLMLALMQSADLGGFLMPTVALSLCALAWFIVHERRAPEPLLPVNLWRDRVLRTCNLGSLVIGAASMAVSVFLPTYVQGVMGRDAFAAGLVLAFMSVGWPLAATAAGRLMLRTSYRTSALTGGVLLFIGSVLLALFTAERGTAWASGAAFVIGAGMGLLNSSFTVAVQDAAPWQLRGIATAANTFNRMLGAAIGTAVLGAVVNLSLAAALPQVHDPLLSLTDPAQRADLPAAMLATTRGAVAHALTLAFWASVAIAVAALTVAATMPRGMKPGETRRGPDQP
jgi:EmrB/QacA subfamily drug resistance transporter